MSSTPVRRPRLHRFVVWTVAVLGTVSVGWGGFLLGLGILDGRRYDALSLAIGHSAANPEAQVLATLDLVSMHRDQFVAERIPSPVQRWVAMLESHGPLHLAATAVLQAGTDARGPCGSLCRSMIVLLHCAGFEVRKAFLYSPSCIGVHTVVEVRLGDRWCVFDPTYHWYWRRADGKIASVDDLRRDPQLFATIRTRDSTYPLESYSYDNVHHLRWEKIPGLHALHDVLVRWRGIEWVRAIETPYIYERPRLFAGSLLTGLGLALLLLAEGIHLHGRIAWRNVTRPRAPFTAVCHRPLYFKTKNA